MTLVLDLTISGANTNSYVTLAEFRAFVERAGGLALPALADQAATDAADTLALVQAFDRMQPLPWAGEPTDFAQAAAHPRRGLPRAGFGAAPAAYDRFSYGTMASRYYYAPTEVAREAKQGQMALARWIRQQGQGVELWAQDASLVAGSTVEVEGATVTLASDPHALLPEFWRIVAPLLDATAFGGGGQGARG